MLGIGIDTGGTCTDAVIYDFETNEILGAGKALTTKSNLEIGIANALDTLPKELVEKAGAIGLSTTLATNACVEDKGARAKLLMIGFDESMMDHLKEIYASYGLKDMTRFVILDAKVEGIYSNPFDPDWEDLRRRAKEYFGDCDSVGIVQKHPRANGGRFELTALKILQEELSVPLTISFDISSEVDILKTCAGTLLNARLVPLISDFMQAVHHVMQERGIDLPLSIVRSDGTVMSEDMTEHFPVETILCGPASSVVGGSELAKEDSGIIVDMGGTTTDIAIVHDSQPVLASTGIRIGQWKTMVKGLYVETYGLGGDTAVRYKDSQLYLDTVRVIPISVLAAEYPFVVEELKALAKKQLFQACWIHEYFVLQKDISGKQGYSEYEQKLCSVLKEKPLLTLELAERMEVLPRFLSTERLEADGVILKSGLTPTDMMILKGDFTLYDRTAAEAAVECLFANIREPLEQVPDLVYEMVWKRMYRCLSGVILRQQYPKAKEFKSAEYLEPLLDRCYEAACLSVDHPEKAGGADAVLRLSTDLPLLGVGAPIHIFLPRVAELLHTRVVIPPYAGVANALGAVASRKVLRRDLVIKAEYDGPSFQCLSLHEDGKKYTFKKEPEAIAFGKQVLDRAVQKWARMQNMTKEPQVEITVKENRFRHRADGLLFEIVLSVVAREV